jgi:hypothetical protein
LIDYFGPPCHRQEEKYPQNTAQSGGGAGLPCQRSTLLCAPTILSLGAISRQLRIKIKKPLWIHSPLCENRAACIVNRHHCPAGRNAPIIVDLQEFPLPLLSRSMLWARQVENINDAAKRVKMQVNNTSLTTCRHQLCSQTLPGFNKFAIIHLATLLWLPNSELEEIPRRQPCRQTFSQDHRNMGHGNQVKCFPGKPAHDQ